MQDQVNDGGPAFPVSPDDEKLIGRDGWGSTGITIRDYFAAKALAAIIAHPNGHAGNWPTAAADAYAAADAMLRARGAQ